jgi:hypothetical protein
MVLIGRRVCESGDGFLVNPTRIIESNEYVEGLKEHYPRLKCREGALRRWFHTETNVFFDAEEAGLEEALKKVLDRSDFPSFKAFFIVQRMEEEGHVFELMDATFKNIGGKTITGFAHTFHANLEFMTSLSLQMRRLKYRECVGYSYVG